ncbi:MAG: hypothetical protein ACXWC9_08825 [Pseudobdellovibrionaceae bacterium]
MTLSFKSTSALALAYFLSVAGANAFAFDTQNSFPANTNIQRNDDNDDQDDQNQHQNCMDQDKDDKNDKNGPKRCEQTMRVDCRYHNVEDIHGIKFCYASAIYSPGEHGYEDVRLGIGCDSQTLFNDMGRVHTETVGERISPATAASPAVEIFPQGALSHGGTYESVLDLRSGRLTGTCYVHKVRN